MKFQTSSMTVGWYQYWNIGVISPSISLCARLACDHLKVLFCLFFKLSQWHKNSVGRCLKPKKWIDCLHINHRELLVFKENCQHRENWICLQRLVVWSWIPPIYLSKCFLARYRSPNCCQWLLRWCENVCEWVPDKQVGTFQRNYLPLWRECVWVGECCPVF